jgi:glyoxylase-like metal-dependent hydrolase (beta-lactamase superfamily II)
VTLHLDHGVTSGTFSLDGGTWEVDNNVWVLGDAVDCVIIDAPHDAAAIGELIGDRRLRGILCTHAHDDHVTVARELSERFDAPVRLHPDDDPLWRMTFPHGIYVPLEDGERIELAGSAIEVLHTPGHSPGAVCYHVPELGAVFSGDTLFQGGPGATGRSYSDYDTIVGSIRNRLFSLPSDTVVHTGHGPDTTIRDEQAGADDWHRPS